MKRNLFYRVSKKYKFIFKSMSQFIENMTIDILIIKLTKKKKMYFLFNA